MLLSMRRWWAPAGVVAIEAEVEGPGEVDAGPPGVFNILSKSDDACQKIFLWLQKFWSELDWLRAQKGFEDMVP